jgi:hypothetical protein
MAEETWDINHGKEVHSQEIIKYFGTWTAALIKAGLEVPLKKKYEGTVDRLYSNFRCTE